MLKNCLTHLSIHPENYFPAAYAAVMRLRKQFLLIDQTIEQKIWKRLDLESYPVCQEPLCTKVLTRGLLPEREKRIMQFAQFPTAYGVVHSKVETIGAKAFLKSYLRTAIEDPEYLAHRVSILQSFYALWSEVENDITLRSLWADRLTEFLVNSFTKPSTNYSLIKTNSETALSLSEIAKEILLKPGYSGHHVIALGAAYHLRSELLSREFETLIAKLSYLPQIDYEEIDDNVSITFTDKAQTEEGLERTVINFLQQGPEEPRTLVLADALTTIWNNSDASLHPLIIANFHRFLRH